MLMCAIGCGKHIDTALANVPVTDRCNHQAKTQAEQDQRQDQK